MGPWEGLLPFRATLRPLARTVSERGEEGECFETFVKGIEERRLGRRREERRKEEVRVFENLRKTVGEKKGGMKGAPEGDERPG